MPSVLISSVSFLFPTTDHQSEGRHQVQGFEGAGEFSKRILYVDSNGDSIDRSTVSPASSDYDPPHHYSQYTSRYVSSVHQPCSQRTSVALFRNDN